MKTLIDLFMSGTVACVFMFILVPVMRKLAMHINLVDKPNKRKVHSSPVPLVGGLSIAAAVSMSMLIFFKEQLQVPGVVVASCSLVILITGIIDDRFDVKAVYRLLIQLSCAYAVAATGIRITSLYGILGIHEIPVVIQYMLTVIIVTGTVNAFNLMDGVDGLAGGLGLMGFGTLLILALLCGYNGLALICVSFIGTLAAFLRFNFSSKKIFMGDAGSMMTGFILVCSGIFMLNQPVITFARIESVRILVIISVFLVPVLDSLRVYKGRIREGQSLFKADKSHLHHLLLQFGFSHKTISLVIVLFCVFILSLIALLGLTLSITYILPIALLCFSLVTKALVFVRKVQQWQATIRGMEH
jgi:UDP-GlcNAc:undecaprenyl-phosphate/decaprenyl-phosphate GlcNAc-1-phosphate transferase